MRFPTTFAAALLAPLVMTACGESSGGHRAPVSVVSVTLADAPSASVTSFTVDVTAITLTPEGGLPTGVLTHSVRVDLASLDEFSQVLRVLEVAPGRYDAASISIDFTNASCFLNGQTTAAVLLDRAGLPLTGVLTFQLDLTAAPFDALARNHHVLEFDFDLDASLTVDTTLNSVTVEPVPVFRVDRNDGRELFVFGSTLNVNPGALIAVVDLQTLARDSLQTILLSFDDTTIFQVDGVPALGTAGAMLLAAKPVGTWFEAIGSAAPGSTFLDVRYVEAGTATFNGGQAFVDGFVTDRTNVPGSDATLTVVGTSSDATHTTTKFNTTFTVDVAIAATSVIRRGSTTTFGTDAINIGQRVVAFGTLTGTVLDATAPGAIVREVASPVAGLAVAAAAGAVVTLDISRVGPLAPTDFAWINGGTSPPDPNNLTVDGGTLTGSLTITTGTPLLARVFFTPLEDAIVDSSAVGLVDLTDAPVLLTLHDRLAGFTVATSAAGGQIQFTITGVQGLDEEASLDFASTGEQALPLTPDPKIAAGPTQDVYVIRHVTASTTEAFALFADFAAALDVALTGGETVRDVVAVGSHEVVTNTLVAARVVVVTQ